MPEVSIPRVKACTIIRELKIADPSEISIEDIAWTRGALVIENGLRGADARLVYTLGVRPAIIRVNSEISPPGRKRFAIAHELGHFELKHRPGAPTECSEKDFLVWYKSQNSSEVEANLFAAELLMPEAFFAPRLENTLPSLDLVGSLADLFQTTFTATAIRYVDLCGERCALVFSTGGKVVWSHRNPEFHHWIQPGRTLSPNTYAADFFTAGTPSTKIETVRLDAWVEGNVSERDTIREQSRPLPSYNSVLTLLWVP
jgi:Zn-dependent peptidase ImmA (M78 family)